MKKTITITATLLLTISAIAAVPGARHNVQPAERPVATPAIKAEATTAHDYKLEREGCCNAQQ